MTHSRNVLFTLVCSRLIRFCRVHRALFPSERFDRLPKIQRPRSVRRRGPPTIHLCLFSLHGPFQFTRARKCKTDQSPLSPRIIYFVARSRQAKYLKVKLSYVLADIWAGVSYVNLCLMVVLVLIIL